jgi:hypothetical protein
MASLQEASLRHATFYLRSARSLDREYMQDKSKLFEVLQKFDFDWGNIIAGHSWSISNFQTDNKAAYLCTMYPSLASNLLQFRQTPQELLNVHKAGLRAAQMIGINQNIGTHLAGIGLVFFSS